MTNVHVQVTQLKTTNLLFAQLLTRQVVCREKTPDTYKNEY